jgi:hypothetical protein
MTRIRKAIHESPSPVLPLVKIFLILLILLLLPDLVTSKQRRGSANRRKTNRVTKSFNALKQECIQDTCDPNNMAENEMCITECISNECFHIYRGNELEAGEIDERRSLVFEQCAKDEIRTREAQRRRGINDNVTRTHKQLDLQLDTDIEQNSDEYSQEEDELEFPFVRDQDENGNTIGMPLNEGANKYDEAK